MAAGVALALPGAAFAANLIGNSGFESPLNAFQQGTSVAGDTVHVSYGNWQPWASVNNRDTGYPASVRTPHTGSFGGEYFTTTNDQGGNNSFFLQDLPDSFAPNEGYGIDAWIYPIAGTTELTIHLHWDRDAGSSSDATGIVVTPEKTLWSAFSAAGEAPALSYNAWHHVRLVGHGGTRMVEVFIDDTRVVSAFGTRDYDMTDTNGSLPDFPLVIGNTDGHGAASNRAVVDDVGVLQLAPDDTTAPTITGIQIPLAELFNANSARAIAHVADAVGVTKVGWQYSTNGGDTWTNFHAATYDPIQDGDAVTDLSGLPDGRSKVRAIAFDAAGNASQPSPAVDANVDSTPPEIAVTCDDGPCAGWFTDGSPVSVSASVDDANPTSLTYTTDTNPTPQTPVGPISITRTTHFTFRAVDGADNVTVVDQTVQIDSTPPLTSISFRDAHNAYAQPSTDLRWPSVGTLWFNPRTGGSITVDAQAIDPESAAGSTADFSAFDTSGWSVTALSDLSETIAFGADSNVPTTRASVGIRNAADFDAAHRVEYVARADSTPPAGPTVSCDQISCSNPNGPVIVSFGATDAGSGIAHVWHTTDGSEPSATNGAEGDTVTMEQPGTVRFVSVDNVGNTTDPIGVNVEQASPPPPTNTFHVVPTAGDPPQGTGYFLESGTPVTITATGSVNCGGGECNSGPEGFPSSAGAGALLPAERGLALLARVGTDGPWTYVGAGPTRIAGIGELFFAVNDSVLYDNYGPGYDAVVVPVSDPVQPGPTFVVNTADDHNDSTGCTLADCSFREAIDAANAYSDSSSIIFLIPLPAPVTIHVTSPLPEIAAATVVDGSSQRSYLGPGIVLDGGAGDGLVVRGDNARIRGFIVEHFSGIGIHVFGSGVTVDRNWLGLDPTGTVAAGNGGDGIRFENTVGGAAESNVVGGNGGHGIFLLHAAHTNVISNMSGNNGTVAIPNSIDGIAVDGGEGNTIGGPAPSYGNVASGNRNQGISLFGASNANVVTGNYVGTGVGGDGVIGNGGDGIRMDGSANNVVGGTHSPNTVVGNGKAGVAVTNAASTGNQIIGNSIHDNAGLGIDLGSVGVTPNDEGDGDTGPNNLQNFPGSIGSAQLTDGSEALDSGLVHHWAFDEKTGSSVTDSVGGANGTIVGSATRVPGHTGTGAVESLSTSDGYVEFPGSVLALGTSDFTVSFWLRTEIGSSGFTDYFGNRTEDSNGNYISIRGNFSDGVLPHYSIEVDDGGPNYAAIETGSHPADGQWHLLSVTRQSTVIRTFWDGAIDGVTDSPDVANLVAGDKTARLGRHLVGFNFISPHAGFDDLRIYNRALSPDEIALLAHPSDGGPPTNLVIDAKLHSAPSTDYRIDVYANSSCDPSGNGEGGRWIGAIQPPTTDEGGATQIQGTISGGVSPGEFITMTATSGPTNDTSEFSSCKAVSAAGRATDEGTSVTLASDVASSAPGATVVGLDNLSLASVPAPGGSLGSAPVATVDIRSSPVATVPVATVPVATVPVATVGLSVDAAAAVGGIPLTELPLIPPDSWTVRLANTVLAGQPAQNLTLVQVLTLAPQAVDGSIPGKPALTMQSIDIKNSILATVPVATVAFGSVHLTDLPIPGPAGESTAQRWCDAYHAAGIAVCPDMAKQTVMSATLQGVPVATVGLESVPVATVNLALSPVATVPVATVHIAGTPVATVPVATVDVAGSPVATVPVATVALHSAALRAIPVATVPVATVDCSKIFGGACSPSTTIGDALDAGAITPGATMLAIHDALAGLTLGDIAAFLSSSDDTMTIGQLAPYLPQNITLRDLLLALMPIASWNWEGADLAALDIQDHASAGGVVHDTVTFTVAGSGGHGAADVSVTLPPGARYVKGSSTLSGPGAAAPPDPDKGAGNVLTWHLASLTYGAQYQLQLAERPGLVLGSEVASAALDSTGLTAPETSSDVPVGVTDASLEPNDTPATATAISSDTLNLGYVTSAGDVDYYTLPTSPGERLVVHLSHLQFDGDVVVYGQAQQQLRSSPVATVPVATVQVGDQGTGPGAATSTQAPQNLADAPRANLPLLGASLNRGTDDEEVLVVTSGGGPITIQVSGFNGASSTSPYVLRVQRLVAPVLPPCPAPVAHTGGTAATMPALSSYNGAKVLFLVNEKRIGDYYGAAAETNVVGAIQSRITKGDFNTIGFPAGIVPLDGSPAVQAAYTAWDQNACSPDAANNVVTQIGTLIDQLRAADSALRYIVLVGSDPMLPMARLVDYTTLSNEADFAGTFTTNNEYLGALGNGYMLSDAVYGSGQPQPYFNRQLYVPDLAVGRLVETPTEIVGQLNAFFGSNGTIDPATAGTVNPTSSSTSGYDFLTDGANAVADQLQANVGNAQRSLIGESWSRTDALAQIFPAVGASPGIVSLNAHYDQNRALPAVGNATHVQTDLLSTTDFDGRLTNGLPALRRRILFTMGCHAGYNVAGLVVPASLDADWPQTFAAQQAVYVANTTYGLGDTAAVAYSEQVMANFAHYLNGTMTVGEAYANAISDYFGGLGTVSPYDEKAGEAATLFGLPMYRFQTAKATPAPPPIVQTQPDAITGLTSASLTSTPGFVFHHTTTGDYYTDGANPPQTTLYQPLEPRSAPVDVTQPGLTAHGVRIDALELLRAPEGITPHYDRPTVDLGANEPAFLPQDASFPDNLSALTTVNTVDGRRQRVVFLEGAFEGNPAAGGAGAGTQSLFGKIQGTVLYSAGTDVVPPSISRVDSHVVGASVSFTVTASDSGPATSNPAPGVAAVQVMYRDGSAFAYTPLYLTFANGVWTGTGRATSPNVEFFVQATDMSGNTAMTRNKAQNYSAAPAHSGPSSTIDVHVNGTTPTGARFFDAAPVTVDAATSTSGPLTYSVDGGAVTSYSAPIAVRGDGFHTVRFADGTSEATVEFGIDTSPPSASIATPHDGAILFIGDKYTADYTCTDGGAGLAATGGCVGTLADGASIPTLRLPGTYTFKVTATDVYGRSSVATSSYVLVPGIAFLPPALGGPVLNVAKAGGTIPVNFSLLSNLGLNIFDPGYPRSQQVACPTGLTSHTVDIPKGVTAGLTYDARTTLYTYGFKTDPSWVGTCREFTTKFRYGSVRKIQFKFVK